MNDTQEGQEVEEGEVDNTFEKQAKEMGWTGKEQWDGPEDKWVDAKTFVERGEHILPILRANNKRLKSDLLTRDKDIATLKASVEVANKAIKALQKTYTESTKLQVEQAKKELREQLLQARQIGDLDSELEIQDKLTDLKESSKEAAVEADTPAGKDSKETLSPEYKKWQSENSWFGDMSTPENRKRTRALVRISEDLREEDTETSGLAFMEKCMEILEKQESGNTGKGKVVSKVEGRTPGGGSGSGRAFDKLSKEAKSICHEDNDSFVGPGKMFKTVKEWEDHYASLVGEE